jgi:hypothetical protein
VNISFSLIPHPSPSIKEQLATRYIYLLINMTTRILYCRLPCNPIFPIGVVYLSDHVHKMFPDVEQRIFDVGAVPPLDYGTALDEAIDEFQPNLLVYSWRELI